MDLALLQCFDWDFPEKLKKKKGKIRERTPPPQQQQQQTGGKEGLQIGEYKNQHQQHMFWGQLFCNRLCSTGNHIVL